MKGILVIIGVALSLAFIGPVMVVCGCNSDSQPATLTAASSVASEPTKVDSSLRRIDRISHVIYTPRGGRISGGDSNQNGWYTLVYSVSDEVRTETLPCGGGTGDGFKVLADVPVGEPMWAEFVPESFTQSLDRVRIHVHSASDIGGGR